MKKMSNLLILNLLFIFLFSNFSPNFLFPRCFLSKFLRTNDSLKDKYFYFLLKLASCPSMLWATGCKVMKK